MTEGAGVAFLRPRRGFWSDAFQLLLLAVSAWQGPTWALRASRPALLNFGPNDEDYVRGFRQGWERLDATRFHWTSPSARVTLPLQVRGDGHVLRMRVRRHFIEPAHVRLIAEGRTVGAPFDIKADTHTAYFTIELPLPPLEGKGAFVLLIEAPSENPAPLGIALDWIEIRRQRASAVFEPLPSMQLALLLAVVCTWAALRLTGASRALSTSLAGLLLSAAALGTAWDVIATERILREGVPVYLALATLGTALLRWPRLRRCLALEEPVAGILAAALLTAAAIRLVLVLHPQFYYPDVKVHALFVWELARRGLLVFLRDFTTNQFRYSLGLQMVRGHWYAFPYPPAFYLLCWPLVRWLRFRPEVAVSVMAAAINSLEVLIVYAIARALRLGRGVALTASWVVPVLPLFLARLALAYFPALLGHAVDALVVCFLVAHVDNLQRPRVILGLAGLLALAALAYTQGLLNFGFLLPLFLILQWARDRAPAAGARRRGLILAGLLGVGLAVALFYGRYIPVFLDMQRGVPMSEERALLEKQERSSAASQSGYVEPEPQDPFTGPRLDPLRGLRKAAWRAYVFYGFFAVAVLAGLVWLVREQARQGAGSRARFLMAWALTYVALNLASGGLPGPNLVRYNKDLELVAPLCCLALGSVGVWLWERARVLGLMYGAAFWAFGLLRAVRYLTATFVLER